MRREITSPHPGYTKPELRGVPVSERQTEIAKEILGFRQYIKDEVGYSQENQALIDRGLHLCLTHEFNVHTDKRSRKFDHTPYIFHPLAMAREAARMRQHPTIVLAALLHDVPEDVKYGSLDSAEKWIQHISDTFADYPDRERLIRILRAELKTESFDRVFDATNKKEVVNYYLDTPLGKTALGYLDSLRKESNSIIGSVTNNGPSEEDQSSIAEVIYDLNRILSESFIPAKDGDREFDPSILVVKILDTWQNLQTPGFWQSQLIDQHKERKDARTVAKLVRARVLTNIAEFLGMRKVSSDMTKAIASLHNVHHIDFPMLKQISMEYDGNRGSGKKTITAWQRRKSRIQKRLNTILAALPPSIREKMETGGLENEGIDVVLQMPWAAAMSSHDKSNRLTGQIVIVIRSEKDLETLRNECQYYIDDLPLSKTQSIRAMVYSLCGRGTRDFSLRNNKGNIIARVRLEEPKPRLISTTRDTNITETILPNKVPEAKLWHAHVCEYTVPDGSHGSAPSDLVNKVDTRLVHLINFMLSPQKFITNTSSESDVPYIIFIGGQMYLATNEVNVTVWDMATRAGIVYPVVRAFDMMRSRAIPVQKDDTHVLDKLRRGGLLPYNIAIVEEGKSKYGAIYPK